MDRKLKFILAIGALGIIACSQVQKNYVAKVKLQKLTEADMYNKELVYDVLFDSHELKIDSLKNKSRRLFLKGIDLYKNKKDATAAITLFKQSILTFPDGKTYYEMGNAILDSKGLSPKDAISAYNVAEYLDFKPISMVYFKTASAYNMLRNNDKETGIYNVTDYLERAFENGFTDTALITNDPDYIGVITTPEYRDMILRMKTRKASGDLESLFGLYKKSFQEYKQPFEISFDNVGLSSNVQSISYDYEKFVPEMQNTSFGREVSHDYYYVAKVAETPVYTAMLYSSISFWEGEMQPVHTKLVTYDPEGNIIAAKLFAAQFSAEKIKTGRIEENEITLRDYKRVWQFPIDKVSFEENVVEKYELLATATFKLMDSGDIMEVSVPANYSDSIVFVKNNL